MSKNFTKYFFNNLKEAKYLSSIDRVEFDSTKTDGNDLLSDNELKKRREKLDDIQIRARHQNMRIYTKNMLSLRVDQFFTLVVPTALVVGTVASFVAPYRRIDEKKYSRTYVKEETVLSNEDGQIVNNDERYYYDSGFFALNDDKFVKENEHNYYSNSNSLTYQISDGIDSLLANFSYDENGKLTFNGVDVGKYIDVSEYDFTDASSIDERYENLFDEVLTLIESESDISSEVKERLEEIARSEDRKIIINIAKYENIGSSVTEIYKTRFWQRTILLVVTGIYLALLIAILKEPDSSKRTKLSVSNGSLYEQENCKIGFWHVALKYKEAFIRAEVERIKKAQKLADEYVSFEDINDLFTTFEKKLTLVDKKER